MQNKKTWVEQEYDYLSVTGSDAVDLLGRISTGDLRALTKVNRCAWTAFTTNQGKMIDWCFLVSRDSEVLIRCTQARGEEIKAWIEQYVIMEDVTVQSPADHWRTWVLDGVDHAAALPIPALPGVGECVSEAGALYVLGLSAFPNRVNVMIENSQYENVLSQLREAGFEAGEAPALEHARISAGVPSPCWEFAQQVNPLELRLAASSISFDKGCYIGQEVIARMDSYDKTARVLMGFDAPGELTLNASMRVRVNGKNVGKVTSVATGEAATVGLAIIQKGSVSEKKVELVWDEGSCEITLADRPFWLNTGS